MNTISERIKLAMEVRNKKQIELVRETGISKGAFSSYLSGHYQPKQDKIYSIANALGVNADWLMGYNVPMLKSPLQYGREMETETLPQYVFYNDACTEFLLDEYYDVYMGLMNEYAAIVPRFYTLVNTSLNEMHMLPLFLKEDCSKFYQCPSEFFSPEKHKMYTRDFESINMVIITSHIYYYGIDTNTFKPQITELTYSQSKKCYKVSTDAFVYPVKGFWRELEKEALYLKEQAKNIKQD